MARPLRLYVPGATYHVTSRGNARQCIFEDDDDYRRFLEDFEEALERHHTDCISFCPMWNHYHALVRPRGDTLSAMMQQLNSKYCQWFNRRHKRIGHVLQGRFHAKIVDDASYMMTVLRYIALNPVAAGLVAHPEQWRWGSYPAIAGLVSPPRFLALWRIWEVFDTPDPEVGRARFTAFVNGGAPTDELHATLLFGGRGLAKRAAPLLEPHQPNEDFVYAHRFAARPPLEEILTPDLTGRRREDAAWAAFFTHAYTLRSIGKIFGAGVSTAWSWVQRARARRQKLCQIPILE